MQIYVVTAACVVLVGAVISLLVFSRYKSLNIMTIVYIAIASLISAIALPYLFHAISSLKYGNDKVPNVVVILAAVLMAYIILILIMSFLISYIIPKIIKAKSNETNTPEEQLMPGPDAEGKENYIEKIFVNFIGDKSEIHGTAGNNEGNMPNSEENMHSGEVSIPAGEENVLTGENKNIPFDYAENLTYNYVEKTASDNVESVPFGENNLEKSVDSSENIDKMGIENKMQDRNTMTIEDCIEEAFRLKESGDSEGAILYYMYALDKKPDKNLTFWIVLDICVLYKILGQQKFALDILNSYYDIYGDIIDVSIKEEIEKNLTDVQA